MRKAEQLNRQLLKFSYLIGKTVPMKTRLPFALLLLFHFTILQAQDFPYGAVALNDLTMTQYAPDTTAEAVVLKEFGEAYIDGDNYHVVFKYHVRIKILKKNGLDQSDIEIPIDKDGGTRIEKLLAVKASSFNLQDGRIVQQALQEKDIFNEDRHKYLNVKKFAIPNVRVGSVIELSYTLESPFVYNFRSWEFQSSIPKVESEYWARIPGIYQYNIALRGFLKLSKNESSIVKGCLGSGGDPVAGGFSADCALMKLGMKNIPAFIEEEYMTAKKNFIASVQFELSEIRYPDGRIDKVTKDWKDAEQELRQERRFGVQLKRGKDIGEEVKAIVQVDADELQKATKVYNFIRDWYVWNNTYGKYSEFGIRKAFDERKGNIGDINLSLIAALRFAGLNVEPVILSTRSNGAVVELYPVLSDFNYVIAKVNIGDKVFLADATQKYYPFGMLPERCLNGKGRVIGDGKSYWIDLVPTEISKTVSLLTLTLDTEGVITGTLVSTFTGYDAVSKRQRIASFHSQEDYISDLKNSFNFIEVTGYELKNVEDLQKPIVQKLEISVRAFDAEASNFLFNPFLVDRFSENPFKSRERLYPVDFGVPMERTTVLDLELPDDFEIVNMPEKAGLTLPNSGARFLSDAKMMGNKLNFSSSLVVRKTVFSSTEYHYLKELFSRILQVQNADIILKKKT